LVINKNCNLLAEFQIHTMNVPGNMMFLSVHFHFTD